MKKLYFIKKNLKIMFLFLPLFTSFFCYPIENNLLLKYNIYLDGNIAYQLDSSYLFIISGSKLEPGDIVFKHPDVFKGPRIIDHCLIYVGYNSTNGRYEFIEAHYHYGVQLRSVTKDELLSDSWGPYCRVKTANESQKQNALSFSKRQIGSSFQGEWINKNFNPTDTKNDIHANEWYCSEIIWAAYYNCNHSFAASINDTDLIYGEGIDIDFNGWRKLNGYIIVAPRDLLLDNDVKRVFVKTLDKIFLDSVPLIVFH